MKFRLEKQQKKTGVYYYYRTDYRLNGKQKTDRVYLGKQDIAEKILEDFVSKKPEKNILIEYSGPLLLFSIAKKLNFQKILESTVQNNSKYSIGNLILLIIITRALHPSSKYQLANEYFSRSILTEKFEFFNYEYNENNIYNYMDYIHPFIHSIQSRLVKAVINSGNINISELILDGTSYSCYGDDTLFNEEKTTENDLDTQPNENDLEVKMEENDYKKQVKEPVRRLRGYSREKRGDLPQINFMLGVNNEYIPLFFDTYAGNTADVTMFSHTLNKLKSHYNYLLSKFKSKYLLFDRGNWNKDNSDKITKLCAQYNFYYIAGIRITHVEEEAINWNPSEDQIIREDEDKKIYGYVDDIKVYQKTVRVLIYFHPSIAQKKLTKLEKKITQVIDAIEELEKERESDKLNLYTKFKSILKKYRASRLFMLEKPDRKNKNQFQWYPNGESIEKHRRLAGKFAVITNRLDMSAHDIYRLYCTKTVVEQSFHLSRHLFDASTIFHSRSDRIETHLALVSWGFLFLSLLRAELSIHGYLMSFERLIKIIQSGNLHRSHYSYPNHHNYLITKLINVPPQLEELLKIYKIPQDYFHIQLAH